MWVSLVQPRSCRNFENWASGSREIQHERYQILACFTAFSVVRPGLILVILEGALHSAHWACTGVSGGWGESSLQEFDHNHETKNQVFMQINDF